MCCRSFYLPALLVASLAASAHAHDAVERQLRIDTPLADVAAYGALAALTLTGLSAVMDARAWARRFELLRLCAVGLAAVAPGLRDAGLVPAHLLLGYVTVSLATVMLVTAAPGRLPGRPPLENLGGLR